MPLGENPIKPITMPQPNDGEENRQASPAEQNHESTPEEKEAEDLILSVNEDDLASMDSEELVKLGKALKKSKEFVSQKRHWKAKHDSVEAEFKKLQPPTQTPPKEETKTVQQPQPDQDRVAKLEFKVDHRDLTSEEVDEVFAYAKTKGIKPDEALERPFIKSFLKEAKDKRESEGASPKPSGRGGSGPAVKDYSTMTSAEVQKHREEIMRRHRG